MKAVIIGNGILALTTARLIRKLEPMCKVTIIGPEDQRGCASLAAAAMFNSFAEIDIGTMSNRYEKEKFLFNKLSTPFWPSLLNELSLESGLAIESGFGTFVLNNHASDNLEDENFDAIVAGLQEFNEPYENCVPRDIPYYKPSMHLRAGRALFIKREGWVNPRTLIAALQRILKNDSYVEWRHNYCTSIKKNGQKIEHAVLENGDTVTGDSFLLCPGAAFSKIVDASHLDMHFPRVFYGVGCSILLETNELTLKNCIRTPNRGLACGVYSAPQDSTHTLIGASNFISPVPQNLGRLVSLNSLLNAAMEQINSDYYRAGLVKVNVGWRPASEDTVALLGKTSIPNLFIATGTRRDGLHCSPVISKAMSELMIIGKTEYDLTLFKPERKPHRVYSREEAITATVRHQLNAAYQHDFVPSKDRMLEKLTQSYRNDLVALHDKVGAVDWGIPPEMVDMFRYGHATL